MKKLFISDLDGTLLLNDTQEIGGHVIALIQELENENHGFAIASGRSYGDLKKIFAKTLFQMFFICENGALILHKGKVLFKKAISKQRIIEIEKLLEGYECDWVMAGVHTVYTGKKCTEVEVHYRERGMQIVKVSSPREIPEEIVRISVFKKEGYQKNLLSEIRQWFSEIRVLYEDDKWIDLYHKDVEKKEGAIFLMKQLRLNEEQIYVFGDNYNDLSLMEVTKNSYAVDWAVDELRKKARFTTKDVINTIKTTKNHI